MKKNLLLAASALLVAFSPLSHAQDAAAGAKKVAMCIGCHGIVDYKTAFPEVYRVPKLAGQSAKFIENSLKAYASGDRKHPSMRGIAGSMSDADIADVAAFYQAQGKAPAAPAEPAAASAAVKAVMDKAACVSCHGANFSKGIDPSYPKIAGQHPDYLYAALRSYKDNTHSTWGRSNGIMAGIVKNIPESELKAIAKYLGSLNGELETVSESRFR